VAVYGYGMSSIYPLVMSWPTDLGLHLDNAATTTLVIGGCCGEALVPVIVGALMSTLGPRALPSSILSCTLLLAMVYILVMVLGRQKDAHHHLPHHGEEMMASSPVEVSAHDQISRSCSRVGVVVGGGLPGSPTHSDLISTYSAGHCSITQPGGYMFYEDAVMMMDDEEEEEGEGDDEEGEEDREEGGEEDLLDEMELEKGGEEGKESHNSWRPPSRTTSTPTHLKVTTTPITVRTITTPTHTAVGSKTQTPKPGGSTSTPSLCLPEQRKTTV